MGYTNGYTYPTEFMRDPAIQRSGATSDKLLLRMLLSRRVDYILLNTMPGMLRIQGDPALQGKVRRLGRISQDGFWIAVGVMAATGLGLGGLFWRKRYLGTRQSPD